MKKLSLSVADLKVHSFPTEAPRGGAGTVYGAGDTTPACPPKTSLWTCVTTGEAMLYDTPPHDPRVSRPDGADWVHPDRRSAVGLTLAG